MKFQTTKFSSDELGGNSVRILHQQKFPAIWYQVLNTILACPNEVAIYFHYDWGPPSPAPIRGGTPIVVGVDGSGGPIILTWGDHLLTCIHDLCGVWGEWV